MPGTVLRQVHECDPPTAEAFGFGTVWRCECRRRWVVTLDYRESRHGKVWRRRLLPWPRGA